MIDKSKLIKYQTLYKGVEKKTRIAKEQWNEDHV